VVQEAIARREWIGEKEFRESKETIYRSRWRIPSVGEVLGWGLKQLGLDFATKSATGKVVLLANLEQAAREFENCTKHLRGRTERVWSLRAFKESFRDLVGTEGLTDADFAVLLRFLSRDKSLVSWENETVKLRSQGESAGVSVEDVTIANLKTLIADLSIQTRSLEGKVEKLSLTARQAVEKKNRVGALAALRSKKLAETQLGTRHATLAQLEEVFLSIEQAADQVEVVGIMEGSTKVLEGLNEEVGGTERVDIVVDNLREQMAQVEEVGGVIAEAGQEGVDEGEVDDELEALEAEEKRKIEEVERKEREERERKEAEETRKKLQELEEVERKAKENASPEKEKDVEEPATLLRKLSLDPPEKVTA
jgi:charged multivesicular body protein 7